MDNETDGTDNETGMDNETDGTGNETGMDNETDGTGNETGMDNETSGGAVGPDDDQGTPMTPQDRGGGGSSRVE